MLIPRLSCTKFFFTTDYNLIFDCLDKLDDAFIVYYGNDQNRCRQMYEQFYLQDRYLRFKKRIKQKDDVTVWTISVNNNWIPHINVVLWPNSAAGDNRNRSSHISFLEYIVKNRLADYGYFEYGSIISGTVSGLYLVSKINAVNRFAKAYYSYEYNNKSEAENIISFFCEADRILKNRWKPQCQYIEFKAGFRLTERSLKGLGNENVSEYIIAELKHLKNNDYLKEEDFLKLLQNSVGNEAAVRYESVILKHAEFEKEDRTDFIQKCDEIILKELGKKRLLQYLDGLSVTYEEWIGIAKGSK